MLRSNIVKDRERSRTMGWMGYSLATMLAMFVSAMLMKSIAMTHINGSSDVLPTMAVMLSVSLVGVLAVCSSNGSLYFTLDKVKLPVVLLGSVWIFLQYFLWNAFRMAPNPGLALAITNVNVVVVYVASVFVFGSRFTVSGLAGILLVVSGFFLIAMPSASRMP